MPKKWIDEETPIGIIILKKGSRAKKMMNEIMCDGKKNCEYGTTVKLVAAMELMGKRHLLPDIMTKLNNLPNIPHKRR